MGRNKKIKKITMKRIKLRKIKRLQYILLSFGKPVADDEEQQSPFSWRAWTGK